MSRPRLTGKTRLSVAADVIERCLGESQIPQHAERSGQDLFCELAGPSTAMRFAWQAAATHSSLVSQTEEMHSSINCSRSFSASEASRCRAASQVANGCIDFVRCRWSLCQ